MYKRTSQGWAKHLDFIVLDIVAQQIAFFLAYFIRQGSLMPYQSELYRAIGIFITVFNFVVVVILDSMEEVI